MTEEQRIARIAKLKSKTKLVGECWVWENTKQKAHVKLWKESAHRQMYRLCKGDIPDGMFVCHTCDVPKCINPDHLFLGTPKDNSQDSIKKGRFTLITLTGEQKRHKLSASDVQLIRGLYKTGQWTQKVLAECFEVDRAHISRLVRNERRQFGN